MASLLLSRGSLPLLAYKQLPGHDPGIIFLLGFNDTRTNPKCQAMEQFCRETGRAFISFDYRGCGESKGCFEESRLGDWKEDALAVLDELTHGPQVKSQARQSGLYDFLMPNGQHLLMQWDFFEEAKRHGLLEHPTIPVACPVRLLHGMQDEAVPWQRALEVAERLESSNVRVLLVKNGQHGLAREEEMQELLGAVHDLLALVPWEDGGRQGSSGGSGSKLTPRSRQ
ncbi:palmitoyl-protein thioesterase ABHD10, mitochondrial-like isoform X2 [Sceloporus undulatus]|uniref:palmitoyl-protein thioesterase ABHD10, mitochondrial-like isoform X2 n=1 Tax=Sceloporus undulatus TaxID=8520 RepID=UPI001C4D616D|nr:palmitoyl-protein thioesterase ABHD10, mitochondrial-like isoform X2 [Sceloporus undulatus]